MKDIAKLFDLTGKSALVTGATGALGSAAAAALAGAGAHVTLAGGNTEKLNAVADDLRGRGASIGVIAERPSDEGAADRIVAAACADGRGLDIVVSASGTAAVAPALDMKLDTGTR